MQEEAESRRQRSRRSAAARQGGRANGAGDVVAIEISPDAVDPDDPEALADLVLAGVNEALTLRPGPASKAKAQQLLGDVGLGGLGLPGLGEGVDRTPPPRRSVRGPYLLSKTWRLGHHRPRPDRRRDLGLGLRFQPALAPCLAGHGRCLTPVVSGSDEYPQGAC